MSVEVRDARMAHVVAPGARLEKLATGFLFTEGALWHPTEEFLLFSDIPGNIMRRWDRQNGIQVVRQPSQMSNGLTYDLQGRLLACQHASSSVTRTELDGSVTEIATHFGGQQLNSPNDVVVSSDGAIYFSDPSFGRMEFYGVPRDCDMSFRGVYRLSTDGELQLLIDDFEQPNGLCFSLDEKHMFVNDSARGQVHLFDVASDGTLENGRLFAQPHGEGAGVPDGMKIDSEGNLFTCGPGGVHVFASDGKNLGIIKIPEVCANFTWGGGDLKTLFVTASTSLYAINVNVPGRPAF